MKSALIALVIALVVLLSPASAAAELDLPYRIEHGDVIVRAERGLEAVARRVAAAADDELADIRRDLEGLPRPPRIEIRLVVNTEDIGRAAPHPNVPPWAVGVAFAREGVVIAAQRRQAEILDIDNTVAHELAHLALGAALDGRAPRWLNEGFAYLHSSDWSFARFRTLVGMAWSNNVIDLHELDASFPRAEQAAHRAYAQSYDFVAFLAKRGRYVDREDDGNRLPFRRFLANIAADKPISEAARLAFGAHLYDLFGEWRRGLRARYLLVPAEMFGLGVWCLGALLLVIGFLKKKRDNKVTLARWEQQENAAAVIEATRLADARVANEGPASDEVSDDAPSQG